jgi:hypothetical protein
MRLVPAPRARLSAAFTRISSKTLQSAGVVVSSRGTIRPAAAAAAAALPLVLVLVLLPVVLMVLIVVPTSLSHAQVRAVAGSVDPTYIWGRSSTCSRGVWRL